MLYSKDEALREADSHDKATSLVGPGEQDQDTLPTPTLSLSWAQPLWELEWLLLWECIERSLPILANVAEIFVFVHQLCVQ